ncbi:MAG: glutaredoxin family protein [Bdellovibrionota bacterium]
MTFIRWFLGKIILFFDKVFTPKSVVRTLPEQRAIDVKLAGLAIYQYEACPFCVKVRRFMKRQNISLELKDAKQDPAKSELLAGGGKLQVPCLKIPQKQGAAHWLYESNDIISYLKTELHL